MSKTEKTLREAIFQALKKVDQHSAPNVFDAIKTEEGYRSIEQRIIYLMDSEGLSPSAAIRAIETT